MDRVGGRAADELGHVGRLDEHLDTRAPKGRLLKDGHALRFAEVTVNGPKTWSLAVSLEPEISAALDAVQDRAAGQIIGWVAEHATTRVGRGGVRSRCL